MKITTLTAQNLQGKTINGVLKPITAIAGPNFRGKTTHLNAIALALAGYVPGVAKKTNEVYDRLASGSPMRVSVDLDDGRALIRSWTERHGSVSTQTSDDAKGFTIPPVALDPSEFFNLSGPERLRFLFRSTDAPDLKVPAMASTITANLKNIKLKEGNTAATEDAIGALCAFVMQSSAAAGDQAPQEWIETLVTNMREKRKLADQNAKRLESTLAGLTQTAEAATAPADAEHKRDKALRDLDAANTEVGRMNEQVRQLESEVSKLRAAASGSIDEAESVRQINEIEAQRQEELAVPRPPTEDKMEVVASIEDVQKLKVLSDEKERLFKAVKAKPTPKVLTEPRPTDTAARVALKVAEENLRKASDEFISASSEMKRMEIALGEAMRQTTCPTCGHDITDKQKSVIDDLRRRLDAARDVHASATAARDLCDCNAVTAHDALVQSIQAIATWDEEKSSIDRQNQSALDEWNAANDRYRSASQVHADMQDRITKATRAHWSKLNDEYVTAQQRATRLASEAEALRAKMGDKSAAEALARLPQAENDLQKAKEQYKGAAEESIRRKETVRLADADVAKLTQQRADAASRARAGEQSVEAKAEAVVVDMACDMLAELQAKVVERAVGPMLARCNRLCDGILEVPLAIDGGEFGMRRPTGFVNWRTMSGAERALAYCAVSLGLAAGSPIKLVVLDELGRLDARNKVRLVNNVRDLVLSREIDQALLVDTDPKFYEVFAAEWPSEFALISL